MDKLCYTIRARRFVYNSTMVRVKAFHLSCVVEAMPCFHPLVNMRHLITSKKYSYHSFELINFGLLKINYITYKQLVNIK